MDRTVVYMPNIGRRIPRWIVENDPTWERKIDSDPTLLKWNKKGTNIQAVSYPASISCDIMELGHDTEPEAALPDLLSDFMMHTRLDALTGADITKYLSSRYLNANIDSHPGQPNYRSNNMLYRKSLFF